MKNSLSKRQGKTLKWNLEDLPINFPKDIRKIYEESYKINRRNYSKLIDKFSNNYKDDIDWWLTLPSSRNPYISNILNYITVLETLKKS